MLFKSAEAAANPLIPHTAELIVGTIAFSILFIVLRKAVVPMFEKAFAERTEAIQGGIEKAEKAQLEAAQALEKYNSQLASARDEAARLREEARAQAAGYQIVSLGERVLRTETAGVVAITAVHSMWNPEMQKHLK